MKNLDIRTGETIIGSHRGTVMKMKKLAVIVMVALGTVCFKSQSSAQGVVYAPLLVFTNGLGSISPFQYGQLLEVGQTYSLQAVPDDGYVFSSWQRVDVFTISEITLNSQGYPGPPVTSAILSPVPTFTYESALVFTMQPVTLIFNAPDVRTITKGVGWQANFSPVPEPSGLALILGGLATVLYFRARHSPSPSPHLARRAVKPS